MAIIRVQREICGTKSCLVAVCVCAMWISGCYTKQPRTKPVVTTVMPVRPILPASMNASLDAPPELETRPLPAAPVMGIPRGPARPRQEKATQEPAEVEKHEEPTIAPEVPSDEARAAQAETQLSLDTAEKNLALAQGKNLNAAQQDLISKVKSFAESAHEAIKGGDWLKAKNLASKAQVLSEQLAKSF
jgi:hypothetical protein